MRYPAAGAPAADGGPQGEYGAHEACSTSFASPLFFSRPARNRTIFAIPHTTYMAALKRGFPQG